MTAPLTLTLTHFQEQFKSARRASTPLVAVRTFDASATIHSIKGILGTDADTTPIVQWDSLRGFTPVTPSAAKDAIPHLLGPLEVEESADCANALIAAQNAETDYIIVMHNMHLQWDNAVIKQGIWNLRNTYKAKGAMLIMLCTSGAILPAEIASDTLTLEEPLPTVPDLERITVSIFEAANTFRKSKKLDPMPVPSGDDMRKITDALIGLSAFASEQALAMSLRASTGVFNVSELWDRKRDAINSTPGLSVMESSDNLSSLGGLDSVKQFLTALMNGRNVANVIVFTDEVEKAFAGTGTDTSGTKTELTGGILSWTSEKDIAGILLVGVPGGGKTALVKAMGNEFTKPVYGFDIAGMQASLVGQSSGNLRNAIATVNGVSDGRILWIATCNSVEALPPELLRRFKDAVFFFDVPAPEERSSIWQVHTANYGLTDALPVSDGWTGAEIRECCSKAYRLNIPLTEAAKYIVPVTVSSRDRIDSLRARSSGKYLSASNPGVYRYTGHSGVNEGHSNAVPDTANESRRFRSE